MLRGEARLGLGRSSQPGMGHKDREIFHQTTCLVSPGPCVSLGQTSQVGRSSSLPSWIPILSEMYRALQCLSFSSCVHTMMVHNVLAAFFPCQLIPQNGRRLAFSKWLPAGFLFCFLLLTQPLDGGPSDWWAIFTDGPLLVGHSRRWAIFADGPFPLVGHFAWWAVFPGGPFLDLLSELQLQLSRLDISTRQHSGEEHWRCQ